MKAIVLIGGFGTRLRPLTYNTPKSLLPIANVPFLRWTFRWFQEHGVKELILALGNLAPPIVQFLRSEEIPSGLNVRTILEEKPLGSGGALKNCAHLLDGTFVLFNGDILTDLDLSSLISFHRQNKASITATLAEVDDPSHYGIVHLDPESRALQWQEKPTRELALSRWGNVGAWVMEPEILDFIPSETEVSIEREVFPIILARGYPFFGYRFSGYWKDIGTIDKYLQANRDIVRGRISGKQIPIRQVGNKIWIDETATIGEDVKLDPPLLIGKRTIISDGVKLNGPVIIGDDCVIAKEAELSDSTVWSGSIIGDGAAISGALIASAKIGNGCRLEYGSLVAPESVVAPSHSLPRGTILGPGSILK